MIAAVSASGAFICGCGGLVLSGSERAFFSQSRPWGFILFRRNIEHPQQLRRLADALRDAVGCDAPILVDQEGGRVVRLAAPHWASYPPARRFGDMARQDFSRAAEALALNVRLMARDVAAVGMDVVCLPVLDVPAAGAHEVIGTRAYAEDAESVARLGRIAADALLQSGLLPVAKHVPGHGRAEQDSHESLPRVNAPESALVARDFAPFRALAHLPMMMTAHVLYTALDGENPATFSACVIQRVIRGHIGFDGLLLTDDLSMGALSGDNLSGGGLSGDMAERGRRALAAGCDMLLHCNGIMAEMEALASVAPRLAGKRLQRAQAALSLRRRHAAAVAEGDRERLHELLAQAA